MHVDLCVAASWCIPFCSWKNEVGIWIFGIKCLKCWHSPNQNCSDKKKNKFKPGKRAPSHHHTIHNNHEPTHPIQCRILQNHHLHHFFLLLGRVLDGFSNQARIHSTNRNRNKNNDDTNFFYHRSTVSFSIRQSKISHDHWFNQSNEMDRSNH